MAWSIIREPKDLAADVRISIGTKRTLGSYLVFRGQPQDVVKLLEEALVETRTRLSMGEYDDKRGRPQG